MARRPLEALGAVARAWRRRPARARQSALLLSALLAVLGVGGLAFQLRLPRQLPRPLEWAAVGALLEQDGRPGDAVAVSPAWAERIREVAPPRLPVLAWPRFAGEDLDGVRRIWLVSLPGAPGFSWAAEVDLLERAGRTEPPLALGGLEVARYDLAYPDLPLAFLPDWLARASATQGGAACAPEAGGFRCGPGGVGRVIRTVAELGGLPRPCLLFRADGPGPLSVSFPAVPVGRVLRGHAGALPAAGAAAVRLAITVRVDGEEAGVAELPGSAWRSFRVDTSRWAHQPHTVTLQLGAPSGVQLCLDAATLP